MTKYITTLIMSLCCIAAAGQNKCNITGTVVDTKGEAISYASAVLYDDGKIATGGVTSDNGKFILTVDSSSKEFELSVVLMTQAELRYHKHCLKERWLEGLQWRSCCQLRIQPLRDRQCRIHIQSPESLIQIHIQHQV